MSVTSLSNMSHPNGLYSGMGKMIMPLGITLNCSFSNIQIGTDMVMYNGEVKAVTEGVGSWMTQWNLYNWMSTVDYNYQGEIDSVYVVNGQIIIVGDSGQTTIQNYTPPFTIQSSDGTMYTINADGSVTIENPIPHIALSAQQKNVYIMALTAMRNENSPAVIAQYEQAHTAAKQAYDNKITTDYGLDYNNPPNNSGNVTMYVIYYDTSNVSQQPFQEDKNVKQAEFNVVNAKVCRAFARPNPTDFDFDILANFLYLGGMPSYQYIAQGLSQGKTEQELADEVKAALYVFIADVLYKEVFTKPDLTH
jgi:hypothetical protein